MLKTITAIALLLSFTHAYAETNTDCHQVPDYKKMVECFENDAIKIDKALNTTYQQILKKSNSKQTLETYPKAAEAIKQNQRDWLRYAENYCNLKSLSASTEDKNLQGSYYITAYRSCFSSLSISRIQELKDIDCEEGDMSSTCIIIH